MSSSYGISRENITSSTKREVCNILITTLDTAPEEKSKKKLFLMKFLDYIRLAAAHADNLG